MKKQLQMLIRVSLMMVFGLVLASCSTINEVFSGKDNAYPPAELTAFTPQAALQTVWTSDHGKGSDHAFVSLYPVIYENQIISIDREGYLAAYDRYKGNRIWEKKLDKVITGGLTVADNIIFVSSDDAHLYALSATNGDELWKKRLSSISLSRTAVNDSMVFSRTIDGKLYALDKRNGEKRWIYDIDVPVLTFRGNSSPVTAGNDLVFTGFDSGKLVAIAAQSGLQVWEATVSVATGRTDIERLVDIDGDPVLIGEQVFAISMNGHVSAINVYNGQINWTRKISSFVSMGYDQRNIYITDDQDNLWAVGQANGDIVWKQDKLKHRRLTTPVILGKFILTADFEGYLHVLSTRDGEIGARIQLDTAGYLLPPLLLSEDIYVYGSGGKLNLLNLSPL